MTSFEELNQKFRDKGRTLGSVESFTGGLFAKNVTDVPGASHFFKGALVTYFTETKSRLLDIDYAELDKNGVVSEKTATDMAYIGSHKLRTDYCVSFTGNAGPDAMEGKEAGLIFIGICVYNEVFVFKFNFQGDRESVRNQACEAACALLLEFLDQKN